MTMQEGGKKLEEIASRLKSEIEQALLPDPERVKVRALLKWFGYERRGNYIVRVITNKLEALELLTEPDFTSANIDDEIAIELDSVAVGVVTASETMRDPTVRIRVIDAALRKPTSVSPDAPLSEATTIMQMKDYSQLPVMQGDREVKGVISWKSIGSRYAMAGECAVVRQCLEPARETTLDTPLLDAISDISEHGYVLVRGEKRLITGIVTYSDIGNQLRDMAGPFLIIGEIEVHLRRLVHRKFTLEELRQSAAGSEGRPINGSADLTLGNYCHLLQKPGNWGRLGLPVDRALFNERLQEVRNIRNDVMHFNLVDLEQDQKQTLQEFVRYLRELTRALTR